MHKLYLEKNFNCSPSIGLLHCLIGNIFNNYIFVLAVFLLEYRYKICSARQTRRRTQDSWVPHTYFLLPVTNFPCGEVNEDLERDQYFSLSQILPTASRKLTSFVTCISFSLLTSLKPSLIHCHCYKIILKTFQHYFLSYFNS